MLGLLVITDVLCREPKPTTQVKDVQQAILYIRGKLGIRDIGLLSEGLPDRLGVPQPDNDKADSQMKRNNRFCK